MYCQLYIACERAERTFPRHPHHHQDRRALPSPPPSPAPVSKSSTKTSSAPQWALCAPSSPYCAARASSLPLSRLRTSLGLSMPPASAARALSHPLSRPSSPPESASRYPCCLQAVALMLPAISVQPERARFLHPLLFKPPSRSTPVLTPCSVTRLLAHRQRHRYVPFTIATSSLLLRLTNDSSPRCIDYTLSSISATVPNAVAQAHLPTTHESAKHTLSSHPPS